MKLPTKLTIRSRNLRLEELQVTAIAWAMKAEELPPRCSVVTEPPPQLTDNPDMILLLAATLADSPEIWIWVKSTKPINELLIQNEKTSDQILNYSHINFNLIDQI